MNAHSMRLEDEIKTAKFQNPRHKVAVNLIFTCNWLCEYETKRLKLHNLTMQQFNILRILRGQQPQPATVKLLRERMIDKSSDASRIVDKLLGKGLVNRAICREDRRQCDIMITKKGLSLLTEIDKETANYDRFFSNLPDAELIILSDLLDRLRG